MNDNEMKSYMLEKIHSNTTGYFAFETSDNIFVGTTAQIDGQQVKISKVKVINKNDYNDSYYYDEFKVFIFEIETFANCQKSYYDSFSVDIPIDYPNI